MLPKDMYVPGAGQAVSTKKCGIYIQVYSLATALNFNLKVSVMAMHAASGHHKLMNSND